MLKGKYRNKLLTIMLCMLLTFALCACGETEKIDTSYLKIGNEGSVTSVIVEDFDKAYYTIEGLENMIQEEIFKYNETNQNAISLESTVVDKEKPEIVTVTLKFAACDDYSNFNDVQLFYGTVEQALNEGYSLNVSLDSVADDGTSITMNDIASMSDSYILIMEENGKVLLPKKAVYISSGVTVINSKHIDVESTDGLSYVIMK